MKRRKAAARSRAPTQRQLRVGEELRHALVRILERAHFHDPDLAGAAITVTEVRVGPDLRAATAFVTPLGGIEMARRVAALNRAQGYFRRELAHELALRHVPAVTFEADTSFDYSNRIEAVLHRPEVARDLGQGAPEDGAEDGDHGP